MRIAQFCLVALVVGGVGAAVWGSQPTRRYVLRKEPIPAPLQEAGRVATAIARDDAALQSEMDKITALIDAERPDKFDIHQEMATAEALRAYVEKLLRLGQSAVASLGKMKKTAHELDLLLKEAPARYREAAKVQRRYEEEEKRADIKENYRALADIWEAKAKAAELHHDDDVQKSLNSPLEGYLKRENLFLERFLTMLDQGLAVEELRGTAEFTKTLRDVTRGHEYLRDVLRTWRERMTKENGD